MNKKLFIAPCLRAGIEVPLFNQPNALQFSKKDSFDLFQDFKFAVYLVLLQSFLMFVSSAFLLRNQTTALLFYEHVRFLKDYVPILWRFSELFDELNRAEEFYPVFAIYVLDIVIQFVFFSIFVIALLGKIDLTVTFPRSIKENLLFVFLLLLTLFATADLFFGSVDIRTPGAFSNRLIEGSYFSGVFIFCFLVPLSNLIFYFLVYTRYGKVFAPVLRSRPKLDEEHRT